MSYFIHWIVFSIICGKITNFILRKKGQTKNWFWLGFFFKLIAIVFALIEPKVTQTPIISPEQKEELERKKTDEYLSNGGWICNKCGKVLPSYTGTCGCGNTRLKNDDITL